MNNEQKNIEQLLPDYFKGTLSASNFNSVENWRMVSQQNQEIFTCSKNVWKSLNLLDEMEQYDPQKALKRMKLDKRHIFPNYEKNSKYEAISESEIIGLYSIDSGQLIRQAEFEYTATTGDETLDGVLELLAMSVPLELRTISMEQSGDNLSRG